MTSDDLCTCGHTRADHGYELTPCPDPNCPCETWCRNKDCPCTAFAPARQVSVTDTIERVLREHPKKPSGKPWYLREGKDYRGDRLAAPYQTYQCKCGNWEGSHSDHLAHLAAVIAERLEAE